jgi:hypothetical protein
MPRTPGENGKAPARLWQDPLGAVLNQAADEALQLLGEALLRPVDDLLAPDPPPKSILFLLTCINPQNVPETAESRRRERYATLSALSTAGYVPDHAERTAYVKLSRNPSDLEGPVVVAATGTTPAGLLIPYEVVRPNKLVPKEEGVPPPDHPRFDAVCVLWVSENLGKNYDCSGKLDSLRCLKDALEGALKSSSKGAEVSSHFAITGRLTSTQVADLIDADSRHDMQRAKPLQGVTLYVTESTAPFVRDPANWGSHWKTMKSHTGLTLEYLIGTDDQLADALMNELKQRDVHPERGDSLALIAESDTAYGRSMHPVFRKAALRGRTESDPDHVHHYAYLRGLDGKLPGDSKNSPTEDKETTPRSGRDSQASLPTSKEAEGDPQVDYLRRLVDRMKSDHTEFKAIGVVGNDVYDKLLLLKALRPRFPEAVFFTTDLDVRLLQPGNFADVRNLLIASHFGLTLTDALQDKIAPFRSGYDAASYLSVLRAVEFKTLDDLILSTSKDGPSRFVTRKDAKPLPVHLYEVSRSGAYELTLYDQDQDPLGSTNPRLEPWITRDYRHWKLLLGLLLVAVLLYPLSRPWQAFVRSCAALLVYPVARLFAPRPRPAISRFQVTALVATGLGLVLVLLIYLSHVSPEGEPFEIYEGLSVWPTIVLRFLASILCLYYVLTALKDLRARNANVRKDFLFGSEENPAEEGPPSLRTRLRQARDSLRTSWRAWVWNPVDPEARAVWREFEAHGAEGRRFWRCLLLSIVYLLLFAALWFSFEHGMVQARGAIALWTNRVVLAVACVMLVGLLVFVVDVTLLCHRLVTYLARHAQKWPEELMPQRASERGLDLNASDEATGCEAEEALRQWLLIRLINDATNVVARLIYYPFIVLLILIVAQNQLFDDWHWNVPLVLIVVLSGGTALVCGLLLQRSAKKAKEQALEVLAKIVVRRVGRPEDEFREKIERLRTEVENLNSSAFASFFQNPVLGALLLPLGGGGSLAALETLLSHS